MWDLFRDSALGHCLRFFTRGRLAPYPEQLPDFQIPSKYLTSVTEASISSEHTQTGTDRDSQFKESPHPPSDVEAPSTRGDVVLVTWYSDHDPDNPQNWSTAKKSWVSFLMQIYTFSAYLGSSIYTASIPELVDIFHTSETVASLGLSLYIFGYGMGPMFIAPLSEVPVIGRNPLYISTFILFVVLCVPTALVNNLPGLLILRFLLGLLGSPGLAVGGATHADVFGPAEMPYVISLWGGVATLGPALGPLLGGFAAQAKGWRWPSWELLWLSGPILIAMFLSLPETSADTILLRRAKRLRTITNRTDILSESEVKQASMKASRIAFEALIKPWEINILDPAVLYTTVYSALVYGIYYSFFESFPLVYSNVYGFDLAQVGLAFLSALCALIIAVIMWCAYFYFFANPQMAKMDPAKIPPELRMKPALVVSFFIPVGLFLFAWTARESVHWVVSLVGVGFSMFGVWLVFQCILIYLPFTYPRYAGSLFAANTLARASFAAGAVLFSRPMFLRLGVPVGVSILGALSTFCIVGIYGIYFYGAQLRKRSRFAVS